MIVFHEGLPGAGKSYEACVYHIIPALQAGRVVVTNIEGINHAKFFEVTGIPVPVLKNMLRCVYHPEIEDVDQRHRVQLDEFLKTPNDSLLVIDEIQNLHPPSRQPLSPEWSKFITEHRHNGLDVILMGQDRRDCHALWRRRIHRLITFTKQTALGRDGNYLWRAYEASTAEKFTQVSSGSRKYEEKYFGLYASHTQNTDNKSVYKDKRTNIFKTGLFTVTIPLALFAAAFGIWFLVKLFSDPSAISGKTAQTASIAPVPPAPAVQSSVAHTQGHEVKQEAKPPPIDAFDDLAQKYRPRLAGVVASASRTVVKVDFLDGAYHVQDSFTIEAILAMGWQVSYDAAGLHVTKQGKTMLIRPWPIEMFGKTDNYRTDAL